MPAVQAARIVLMETEIDSAKYQESDMHRQQSTQLTWSMQMVGGLLTVTLICGNAISTSAQGRPFNPPPGGSAPAPGGLGTVRLYNPPQGGSPPGSGSIGGSRSGSCTGASDLTFTALAPYSHVGATSATHPTFSWYVPDSQPIPIDFQLYAYGSDGELQRQPVYQTELSSTPGVMTLTLPETESGLVVGQRYYWQVALLCDPSHPSEDAIAGADIQIVEPTTPEDERWYDLLNAAANSGNGSSQTTDALLRELAMLERSNGEEWAADPNADPDALENSQEALQQSDRLMQIVDAMP